MKKILLFFKSIKLTNSNQRKLNNYKGFTLIELLAVIIILAIIA
ncbi:MAG: prepilin-type N-terminal cleavage/methylation domain-containing protein, partial [Bacilli bacterium]